MTRAMKCSLLSLASLLAGCTYASDPEPPAPAEAVPAQQGPTFVDDVMRVTWEWVGFTTPVEQLTVDASERYTIEFDRDGFAAIQADCNRGQANYFLPADGQIAIHGIALTRAACPPGSLSQRYVSLLELVRTYFMLEGDLLLELPADSGTLRFRRRS
jgi:para-nitrobenzyl esterase